jgi:hypothetical protein
METTNGNAGAPVRLESADGSSEAVDQLGLVVGNPLDIAKGHIARTIDQLTYGRRQEAESAIALLREAQSLLEFATSATGEGQQGREGLDG